MNDKDRRIDVWEEGFAAYRQKLIDQMFDDGILNEDEENDADIRIKEARQKALEKKAQAKARRADAAKDKQLAKAM